MKLYTVEEIIKKMQIPVRAYYRWRAEGKLPPPQTGVGVRKVYSTYEVKALESKLKKLIKQKDGK